MHRTVAITVSAALALLPAWLLLPADVRPAGGTVEDDRGPVAGAVVRVRGQAWSTRTDDEGRFRLPRGADALRLTAAKEGYFIAGFSAGTADRVRLARLPAEDCERYAWRAPTPDPARPLNCGNCHRAVHAEWAAGGHARSATNPHFVNLYDGTDARGRPHRGWGLLDEHPDGAGVCAACHAPTAPVNPQDDFDLRAAVRGLGALGGVHCDFCHKVRGPGTGAFGLTHGRYQLALLRPCPEPAGEAESAHGELVFGPLDDVDRGDDAFSRFQRDSRLCAACHEGTVFGVPVYTTYSEWLGSPAARAGTSCQGCHMAPTGRMTNVAPGHGGVERNPATLGNHTFFDTSQLAMLRRCLHLDVRARRVPGGVRVEAALRVEGAGHRVPTGFIDRQVILAVAPVDDPSAGPLEGPVLPAAAGSTLARRAGELFARWPRDPSGTTPVPFWRAVPGEPADTRLWPNSTRQASWLFPPTATAFRVRLLHRRFWQSVADVKGWRDNETVVAEREVLAR